MSRILSSCVRKAVWSPLQRPALAAGLRWRQCHSQAAKGGKEEENGRIRLVIFDKDGTLMCFNAQWLPWVRDQAKRIEKATGIDMSHEIYRTLGICTFTNRVKSGLLAEGTLAQIREAMCKVLLQHMPNATANEVQEIVRQSVLTPDQTLRNSLDQNSPRLTVAVADLVNLMEQLKQSDVHIAVCTSDSRSNTLANLAELKIRHFVEHLICGDDAKLPPKPSPVLVHEICNKLKVEPNQTAVVGDTKADMIMAANARVALGVGVLSGVGEAEELRPLANALLPNVGHLPQLVLNQGKTKSHSLLKAKNNVSFNQSRTYSTVKKGTEKKKEFDYVIVGAGSAGCVLAYRLSAANKSVCLVEAGPTNTDWRLHMPAAALLIINNPKFNWNYKTVPQRALFNRQLTWPRGKALGGSSSINGMVFMRGNPQDFDRWAFEEYASGWSYADVLPYFKRLETYFPADDIPQSQLLSYRGFEGPLRVNHGKLQNQNHTLNRLHSTFIEATKQAGYGYTHDINGYKQEGAGWFDCTIHGGQRQSTAVAYLERAMMTNRVAIRTNAHTTKLLFNANRSSVVGIQVSDQRAGGKTDEIYASKDVIVSSGAINSPQLLMLSGIGDAISLKKLGIEPVTNLPGVGRNLQDHTELYIQYECKDRKSSLYQAQWHTNPLNMIWIGGNWFLRRTGWGASNHMESGAFLRSNKSYSHANAQIHFLPGAFADASGRQTNNPGMQMHIGGLRPFSRGQLTLRSTNPFDAPLIDPACLEDPRDVTELVECVKVARHIFAQEAFEGTRGKEITPGAAVQSDADLEKFVRNACESAYHPCGSCKMGDIKKDPMAVVDPTDLRVHGLSGLRVVDASVMPSETSGNLNAPTIMIAEKASDAILKMKPAAPSNVSYWKAPQ